MTDFRLRALAFAVMIVVVLYALSLLPWRNLVGPWSGQ